MKFACITDTHFRGTALSRKDDDFVATQLAKFQFVCDMAYKRGCRAILHSGDFGNTKRWGDAYEIFGGVIDILYDVKQRGMDFIVVPGQHDVEGHASWAYTGLTLGLLERSGLIQVVYGGFGSGGIFYLSDDIYIYGFGYDETEGVLNGERSQNTRSGDILIGLIHASVGNERGPQIADDKYAWTGIKDQNIQGLDYALFGDQHNGIIPYELESGCIAASPGAMVRQSIAEIDRQPSMFILDTVKGSFERIKIPAKPGTEIFQTAKVDVSVIDSAQAFKASRARMLEYQEESRPAFVRRIQTAAGMPDEIGDMVLKNAE